LWRWRNCHRKLDCNGLCLSSPTSASRIFKHLDERSSIKPEPVLIMETADQIVQTISCFGLFHFEFQLTRSIALYTSAVTLVHIIVREMIYDRSYPRIVPRAFQHVFTEPRFGKLLR